MISEQTTAIANLIREINEVKTLMVDGQSLGAYLYDQNIAN